MRIRVGLFSLALLFAIPASSLISTHDVAAQDSIEGDKLLYADFEKTDNGRAISNGGGLIQIYGAQESTPVQFKGMANKSPAAPELVRLKGADSNHLASFDFSLTAPNQWANVTLEIQGHPSQDNKTTADDVSNYKNLSVQLYATGVDSLRIEFVSHGQGVNIDSGFPQMAVKLKPGLNTYLIPLKSIVQPSWVQSHINIKDLLKKLTAVSISAYCNQCALEHGTVLVDNLVFQK